MRKIILIGLLSVIIYPSMVSAAWWNPFSWFKRNTLDTASTPMNTQARENLTLKSKDLYGSGNAVARIRLQGELSDAWEKETPKISTVLTEIGDKSAPAEYRSYIVNVFRNMVASNKFSKEDMAKGSQKLTSVLEDSTDSPLVRVAIADMLHYLGNNEKSPQIITAIGSLLDESDQIGSGAVTALRHMGTDAAADILFSWLSNNYSQINTKPSTILTAFSALSKYERLDISSIVVTAVPLVKSEETLMNLMQIVVRMKNSTNKTRALERGYDSLIKMGKTDQAERLKSFIKK